MDVQALVGTTGAGTVAGATSAPATSTTHAPATAAAATPTTPAPTTTVLGAPAPHKNGISPAIAKIFGGDSNASAKSPELNVSYKIENHEIHTVFTDAATGQEIAQFPPDLLANVAAFFDASQGATLDQNA
jgi:hypothetical protein